MTAGELKVESGYYQKERDPEVSFKATDRCQLWELKFTGSPLAW